MKRTLRSMLLIYFVIVSGEALADWGFEPVAVNLASNPGDPNVHFVQGGRRIVRINNIVLALAPTGARDHIYRSTDNGANWTQLENNRLNTYSGCLISGSDELVFHFFRHGDTVYMVKFKYDAMPPAPVAIFSDRYLSYTSHGVYSRVAGTIDRDGIIYVAVHGNAAGETAAAHDSILMIKSEDNGSTWTPSGQANIIRQGDAGRSWGFMHMDVSKRNALLCAYAAWGSESLELAISFDRGNTWRTTQLASGDIYNPAVLPVNDNEIYVFAQSNLSDAIRGLVFTKSEDSGATWSGWQVIDGNSLSGYADPSCGLGADGTIYVAYRSGARFDLIGTLNGEALRERMAMSTDGGKTWSFPDDYFFDGDGAPTARCGTQSQIRYQTWYNYGGPLEWIWLQYEDSGGTQRPVYYDINDAVEIWNHPPYNLQAPTAPKNLRLKSGSGSP